MNEDITARHESRSAGDEPAARMRGVRVQLPAPEHPYTGVCEPLRGLSFTAPRGLVTALVGSNGAGKTTALRALIGAVPAVGGRIHVLGRDMGPAEATLPSGVALVPDEPGYPEHWTADDIAKLLRRTLEGFDARAFGAGLRSHQVPPDRKLSQLSRGQSTQLCVAAALAMRPSLLILDEPLARLDPLARSTLVDELRAHLALSGDDASVLMSTHDLDGMDRFVDHLVVIDQGRTVLEGDVETLRDVYLVVEGDAPELVEAPELIGPEAIGAPGDAPATRALVHVEDAAALPAGCSVQRPVLTDLVTAHLRDARRHTPALPAEVRSRS